MNDPSLRYFFCTLVGRVLPIQTVRLLMRHRDIRTTCNPYLDLGLTDVAEAVLKLPPLWLTLADTAEGTAPKTGRAGKSKAHRNFLCR